MSVHSGVHRGMNSGTEMLLCHDRHLCDNSIIKMNAWIFIYLGIKMQIIHPRQTTSTVSRHSRLNIISAICTAVKICS